MSGKKHRENRQHGRIVMEELQERMDRLQAFVDVLDDQPVEPYFTCSMNLEHAEECSEGSIDNDGEIHTFRTFARNDDRYPCMELTKYDVAIALENQMWETVGLTKQNIVYDFYRMNVTIRLLTDIIIDKLGISADDIDLMYKKKLYETMHTFRIDHEDEIKAAKTREILTRGIIGPNGRPLN